MNQSSPPLLLKIDEAAKMLGLSRSLVYALAADGGIPSQRIGRAVRIPLADLQRWVERNTSNRDDL